MKRKNRKRLAKEAEIARKEARGDFSHLKDRKTGKLRAAPLPQPTLPKIGLDDDLYSDSGSISHHQHQNSIPYGYPPPPSLSNRNIYPYASSDSESLHSIPANHPSYPLQASHRNQSYADSVHSTDGLTAMAAPFGGYGQESSNQLVGPDGRMMPMRAPSYRTMPSEQSLTGIGKGGGDWDEKGGGGGYSEYDHQPQRGGGFQHGYRQDSVDSFQQQSGYGYAQQDQSWEESRAPRYGGGQQQQSRGYEDEGFRAPSRGPSRGPTPGTDSSNLAGRGWGGGYGR